MKNKHFHINTPYFGAYTKYNWNKGDVGLGLKKSRIDQLAKDNSTCIISYGKSDQEYTIKAKKVQEYPIENIKGGKVKVYIVRKSALNYRKKKILNPKEEYKLYLI